VTGNSLNATGVLTASMIRGGALVSTTAANVTATTDTAANIVAAMDSPAIGSYFDLYVVNTGPNSFTVAPGTGVTMVASTASIPTQTSRLVKFVITNVSSPAVTVYM
jgi:hypothetical protein